MATRSLTYRLPSLLAGPKAVSIPSFSPASIGFFASRASSSSSSDSTSFTSSSPASTSSSNSSPSSHPAVPSQLHISASEAYAGYVLDSATKGSNPATFSQILPVVPPLNALDIKDLVVGPSSKNRLQDFYHESLQDDLLYLTYDHPRAIDPDLPNHNPTWFEREPNNPFAINRITPKPRGRRATVIPRRANVNANNVVRIESITLTTMVKEAIKTKSHLLGALHAFRTITGQVNGTRGDRNNKGVKVVYARKGAATWGLRSGMPVGAKVVLHGGDAYRFLEVLTEFVFPRLREWPGLKLHHGRNEDPLSESSTSSTVSLGFGREAMALFPQIESCLDSYPRMYGFHVNINTNQRGLGAQDRSRTLLSGLRVPFYQPAYKKPKKKTVYSKKKSSK